MSKKITVNEKLLTKIYHDISTKLSVDDLNEFKEFEECQHTKLFDVPVEGWSELEHAMYQYNERIITEIFEGISDTLVNGNAR